MSSSGLIYAVIVGAWAAYLVPMWLRRQDELNEARPTERFSTAIRLLSGRAGMERRYAKDLRARSADEVEHAVDPEAVTDSVDVRAFAMPPYRPETKTQLPAERGGSGPAGPDVTASSGARPAGAAEGPVGSFTGTEQAPRPMSGAVPQQTKKAPGRQEPLSGRSAGPSGQLRQGAKAPESSQAPQAFPASQASQFQAPASEASQVSQAPQPPAARAGKKPVPGGLARRGVSAEAAARAQRSKALARRRRTTVMLFLAFTLGSIVAAVGGLALLWAPGVPAVLLSAYIAYLRAQERRRFAFTMDRRRAEAAAQRLRERQRPRRPVTDHGTDEPEDGPEAETRPDLSALAADRRALVEQTDHAEWIDQQRERQRRPGHGESWDPVPVPLPTYVTAPVAPRATPSVDMGAPDAWSSARSSAAEPGAGESDRQSEPTLGAPLPGTAPGSASGSGAAPEASSPSPSSSPSAEKGTEDGDGSDGGRTDARRAASARRARERGRTPLFDQYEDGDRPRAANE
ncbi:divisome protein SepX/GlpR [Streptomyces poonensis]|uniref:Uncharacterized protein n=1 Tax=Streptomyces poonensis TaxID=68255 RepID=A0A918UDL9_9ACTN|nr:gephyrin-like molybdotransferase receptor GlpR [Streptomyces poonensis]GGY93807.1 hypothetical protein GCM10010365_10560 [Streptomyces poonensis]GLJ87504.1 hypothetical protein GCM10017589_01040 [Streptomyces poonensis]